jgi:hypothetical protein
MLNRTNGHGIGYHTVAESTDSVTRLRTELYSRLAKLMVNSSVSYHVIPTDSDSLESVLSWDPYFEQFNFTSDWQKFTESLVTQQQLNSLDVAAYLYRRFELKGDVLQTVLYYVYANYLSEYGQPPFQAAFKAAVTGPREASVAAALAWNADDLLHGFGFDEKALGGPMQDQLLSAIDHVVIRYREAVKGSVVDRDGLVYGQSTPWRVAREQGDDADISDDLIRQYHANEIIA